MDLSHYLFVQKRAFTFIAKIQKVKRDILDFTSFCDFVSTPIKTI